MYKNDDGTAYDMSCDSPFMPTSSGCSQNLIPYGDENGNTWMAYCDAFE